MILQDILAPLPILGPIRYTTVITAFIVFGLITYYSRKQSLRAIYYGLTGAVIWASWYEILFVVIGYYYKSWTWVELWPFLALAGWCFLGIERSIRLGFNRASKIFYALYLIGMIVWVVAFNFDANYIYTEPIRWDLEAINLFTKTTLPAAFILQHRTR